MSSTKKKSVKVPELFKLNLGCGENRHEDFKGVDIAKTKATDYVVDLFKFPWPFKSDSVDEVYAQQFFEHVPAKIRFRFMDELWRVLKVDAKAIFITPYWSSMRAVQDATHEWPPICEASYAYYNETWRRMNGLAHYDVKCNFDYTFGFALAPIFQQRNEETRQFATQHYVNSAADLMAALYKRVALPPLPKEKK